MNVFDPDSGWVNYDAGGEYYSAHEKAEADRLAATDETYDFYEALPPQQPKFEIGQYVADQGIRVPMISDQADWEKAFDEGTAMLRSEMPQDYKGLSGLLSSERLSN